LKEADLLRPLTLEETLSEQYKVVDLKEMLRERGLKVSGRKAQLIARLVDADRAGMQDLVGDIHLHRCTEAGLQVVQAYRERVEQEKVAAHNRSREALAQGDYTGAMRIVVEYERQQLFQRGLNIDWYNYDSSPDEQKLRTISTARPKILRTLSEEHLAPLRIAAGLMTIWGEAREEWFPDDLEADLTMDIDAAARMLLFHANYLYDMEGYRRPRVVRGVRIIGSDDPFACDACRALRDKVYNLDEAPELPHEHCTSELGCRCTTAAALE
jgi:hypothetical protein